MGITGTWSGELPVPTDGFVLFHMQIPVYASDKERPSCKIAQCGGYEIVYYEINPWDVSSGIYGGRHEEHICDGVLVP